MQGTVLLTSVALPFVAIPAAFALHFGTSINAAAGADVHTLVEESERELWRVRQQLPSNPIRRTTSALLPGQSPSHRGRAGGGGSGGSGGDGGVSNGGEPDDSPRGLRAFFAGKIQNCDITESLFGVTLTPGLRSALLSTMLSGTVSVAVKLLTAYGANCT